MEYAERLDEATLLASIRERPPRANLIYEALGRRITGGKIKPGEWLKQDVLAKEFGVTQNTVREALSRLVAEGLATHEPHKGVRVALLSVADIRAICQMRMMLEGWAMEVAAPKMSKESLARMRELLPQTHLTDDQGSAERVSRSNQEFHWIAINTAGIPHLARILRQLWDAINPWLLGNPVVFADKTTESEFHDNVRRDLSEHEELLAALESGDGAGARQAAVKHLETMLSTMELWIGESAN